MARDIPGKPMPSVTDCDAGQRKPGPGGGGGLPDGKPQAGDMGKESYFKCPECGAQLCCGGRKGEEDSDKPGGLGSGCRARVGWVRAGTVLNVDAPLAPQAINTAGAVLVYLLVIP